MHASKRSNANTATCSGLFLDFLPNKVWISRVASCRKQRIARSTDWELVATSSTLLISSIHFSSTTWKHFTYTSKVQVSTYLFIVLQKVSKGNFLLEKFSQGKLSKCNQTVCGNCGEPNRLLYRYFTVRGTEIKVLSAFIFDVSLTRNFRVYSNKSKRISVLFDS